MWPWRSSQSICFSLLMGQAAFPPGSSLPTSASPWLLVPHPQFRGESGQVWAQAASLSLGPVLRSSVWPQAVLTRAASPPDTYPVDCDSKRVGSDHQG